MKALLISLYYKSRGLIALPIAVVLVLGLLYVIYGVFTDWKYVFAVGDAIIAVILTGCVLVCIVGITEFLLHEVLPKDPRKFKEDNTDDN